MEIEDVVQVLGPNRLQVVWRRHVLKQKLWCVFCPEHDLLECGELLVPNLKYNFVPSHKTRLEEPLHSVALDN